MNTNALDTIQILLVEDDPADQKLVRAAFKNARIANGLRITGSGEEAMDFLNRRPPHDPGAPRPDLILLDLNMPGMGGMEFLRLIKEDRRLAMIPVVVMTSSDAEEDIVRSYELHVNAYVTKPVGLEELQKVVAKIEDFWFLLCRLPPKG